MHRAARAAKNRYPVSMSNPSNCSCLTDKGELILTHKKRTKHCKLKVDGMRWDGIQVNRRLVKKNDSAHSQLFYVSE